MSGNHILSNVLNSYESHLKNESKEHRNALDQIRKELKQIKEMKDNRNVELSYKSTEPIPDPIDVKEEELTDSETVVEGISALSVSDERKISNYHLIDVQQYFICVDSLQSKAETVNELFKTQELENAVIYCNSTETVEQLTGFLTTKGLNVRSLNKKTPQQKTKLIEQFMSSLKPIQALITVKRIDGLADVLFYINYDLPSRETYIKKIGQMDIESGERYAVINIVTKPEMKNLTNYEKYYRTVIKPIPLRTENLLNSP